MSRSGAAGSTGSTGSTSSASGSTGGSGGRDSNAGRDSSNRSGDRRSRRGRRGDDTAGYVPLWCKSNFSFLEGASHPEELVQRCRQLEIPALVLADRDGVYGVVRAHVEAATAAATGSAAGSGPRPRLIIGAQVTVADAPDAGHSASDSSSTGDNDSAIRSGTGDSRSASSAAAVAECSPDAGDAAGSGHRAGSGASATDPLTLILLAQNREGYANLCRLISVGRRRAPKGECRIGWEDVYGHAGGLIALWEGRPLLARGAERRWWQRTVQLQEAFPTRLYGLVTRHRLPDDAAVERRLTLLSRRLGLPLAATTEVLYHHRSRRPLQDVVTCIRHRTTLHGSGALLRPNAEHDLKPPAAFARLFRDRPELVAATREIADRCTFSLGDLRYRYPSERLPAGHTSAQWLHHLTFAGARQRYGGTVPPAVAAQLRAELAVIEELDYCGYFLTMYEIVIFCRAQRILCQGRGSAANSAVCYCLGITAIDPVRMDLLFERFLSRERAEPPDIDLDIGHRRREEAIQFMYRKYGRERAAMVANVVRYRAKSAIRDVGKTLGLQATALDRVARLISHHDSDFPVAVAGALRQAALDPEHPTHRLLVTLTGQIRDFPRHLSIHPGGFLLGSEPVTSLVPIENATMEGRTVIQWDKYDVEALGLFKVDLLGLGALTHLDLGFDLIRRHYRRSYTMATVPFADRAVFDMISAGDTVGVFQIESRAQMSMLPRLRPRTFYDLVVQVAIVRPGPITGGMVHPYLRRRNGEEAVEYPHPALRPVLEKTLGVPLFQEQVMKLAVVAADYTPGEADQLRRDMAAWRRSGAIEKHAEKLISRMEAKGIPHEFAERVFNQIRGFGEYGFPESHAASFALVAYLTAWLKHHYHDVFTAALLNAWPMGFYAPATLVDDARRHRVEMRPVDVTRSDWYCTLEPLAAAGGAEDGAPCVGGGGICGAGRDGGRDAVGSAGHEAARGTGRAAVGGDAHEADRSAGRAAVGGETHEADRSAGPGEAGCRGRWRYAVRIGLRYVKGLAEAHGAAIVAARAQRPFATAAELVERVPNVPQDALIRLAESGAFGALPLTSAATGERPGGSRRRGSLWQVLGAARAARRQARGARHGPGRGTGHGVSHGVGQATGHAAGTNPATAQPSLSLNAPDPDPAFTPLDRFTTIAWDYTATGHSARGHPLEPLRQQLHDRALPTASQVTALDNGRPVSYAGLVICRQRPGTAAGVVFMTLEDETGFVNLVVWPKVFQHFRPLILTTSFLGVSGTIQSQHNVVHIVARRFWPVELPDRPPIPLKSHDFH